MMRGADDVGISLRREFAGLWPATRLQVVESVSSRSVIIEARVTSEHTFFFLMNRTSSAGLGARGGCVGAIGGTGLGATGGAILAGPPFAMGRAPPGGGPGSRLAGLGSGPFNASPAPATGLFGAASSSLELDRASRLTRATDWELSESFRFFSPMPLISVLVLRLSSAARTFGGKASLDRDESAWALDTGVDAGVDEVEAFSIFSFFFAWGAMVSFSIGAAAKVVGVT